MSDLKHSDLKVLVEETIVIPLIHSFVEGSTTTTTWIWVRHYDRSYYFTTANLKKLIVDRRIAWAKFFCGISLYTSDPAVPAEGHSRVVVGGVAHAGPVHSSTATAYELFEDELDIPAAEIETAGELRFDMRIRTTGVATAYGRLEYGFLVIRLEKV